ncbi:molybdenum cofactor biosynthesis protein B [Corynebacterium belfantii]|uniref:Molybdenum cofactor biosynthesis protein n=1 Tax=Corynebacterium belfantii TaxID=2014537 RepID=A0ABS0LAU2_9CORY|nr:molybdopterin-binding protein [Corynebacterium belfantii]OLN16281.1 molybdenum cofactor biosynthesis protein [Corynebacterium diphtheriae subsp. lausannense]QVI97851.1 molybdenum cofactor biosynthesis protein [Corynebacterium diphtheriae]MBG9243410.1 molybdenum cofactor biosynthesis protein [Corynebacterium belfantii]MBG9258987.1 molybdenum cofactor biosynthesis protein [Corynebacterium belfantii]MBG9265093.1 molybdenum cofactor biosynthesis protein [Corynebacterium belfantii]
MEITDIAQMDNMFDYIEPDPEFFRATEAEDNNSVLGGPRRALAVLIRDHSEDIADNTATVVAELLGEGGFTVDAVVDVQADQHLIRNAIETAVVGGVDLVLTIGGTGVGPRDRAPEATQEVLDQDVLGIAQAIRASGLACGSVDACTSRGISGVSASTVVVNMAASRSAIRDGMATMTPLVHYVIDQLREYSVND